MLAACKAALSGLSQSAGGGGAGGGRSTPSDKLVEAFMRALTGRHLEAVKAHVTENKSLLVLPLKCHPARCTAWHLAVMARDPAAEVEALAPRDGVGGDGGGGDGDDSAELLRLLLRLYGEQDLPAEALQDLLNMPNRRGQTCLHCAAAHGNAAALRLLLDMGYCGELLKADKNGRNAFHHAAAAGSEDCVRLLLAKAEMQDAARAAAAAAVQEAGCGAGPGVMMSSPQSVGPPSFSSSSLSISVSISTCTSGSQQQQHFSVGAMASRLLSAVDAAGLTALHFAAAANSLPVVRLLLAVGAPYTAQATADNLEPSMPANAGWTCLHVAAMKGHYEVAAAVLKFHASLSTEEQVASWAPDKNRRSSDPRVLLDRRGTSPHALAASRGFSDLAALLHPGTPLSQSVLGGGLVGPDGQELLPPSMFVCPITQEIMKEPVVASDGFTYERAAICKWLSAGKRTSPMTNLQFTTRLLFPNNVLKSAIKEWRQEHKLPDLELQMRRTRGDMGRSYDARVMYGNGGGGDPFLSHLRAHGL